MRRLRELHIDRHLAAEQEVADLELAIAEPTHGIECGPGLSGWLTWQRVLLHACFRRGSALHTLAFHGRNAGIQQPRLSPLPRICCVTTAVWSGLPMQRHQTARPLSINGGGGVGGTGRCLAVLAGHRSC